MSLLYVHPTALLRFSFDCLLLFALFLWGSVSTSFAASCAVDGPDGQWQLVCSGTDCNCGGGFGSGYSIGTGVFEDIAGNQKIVESVRCQVANSGFGVPSCGSPGLGGTGYDACCARYASSEFTTEWPPCLKSAEDYVNSSTSICNPNECAIWRNASWACGTCDEYGGTYIPVNNNYVWPFKKAVKNRSIHIWLCNSCTNDPNTQEDHYQQLKDKCGGVENIKTWDNVTCTGECNYYGKNLGCPAQ